MTHILFITHWYPNESNPISGIFIREHARAVSLYHKVTIIHIQGIDPVNPYVIKEEDGPLTVYHLRYAKPRIPKTGWLILIKGVLRIFNEILRIDRKPDIIHAHIYSSAVIAYLLSRIHNIPVVLTEQASAYQRKLFTKKEEIANRIFLNRLDLIMPVSQALGSQIRKYGIKSPFTVIPNTVDTSLFHPYRSPDLHASEKIRLLTVATLHPIKGINFLIEGFSQLRNNENIELLIVGDGPERSSLERLVSELNLSNKVIFLGLRSKNEIAELMRQVQIFVLTSLWESFAVVLIEAAASGLPIVATSVGGIPEIVKPFCGRLVSPNDAANIGEGINYMIDHLSDFPSAPIAEYAEREYSFQAVGKKYSDIYLGVLQRSKT